MCAHLGCSAATGIAAWVFTSSAADVMGDPLQRVLAGRTA